jgi:hypothetical protein
MAEAISPGTEVGDGVLTTTERHEGRHAHDGQGNASRLGEGGDIHEVESFKAQLDKSPIPVNITSSVSVSEDYQQVGSDHEIFINPLQSSDKTTTNVVLNVTNLVMKEIHYAWHPVGSVNLDATTSSKIFLSPNTSATSATTISQFTKQRQVILTFKENLSIEKYSLLPNVNADLATNLHERSIVIPLIPVPELDETCNETVKEDEVKPKDYSTCTTDTSTVFANMGELVIPHTEINKYTVTPTMTISHFASEKITRIKGHHIMVITPPIPYSTTYYDYTAMLSDKFNNYNLLIK